MKSTKTNTKTENVPCDMELALAQIDYLTTPVISFEPEVRPRDSLSAPIVATCNRKLSPIEINKILNEQIPARWRKQISGVVW